MSGIDRPGRACEKLCGEVSGEGLPERLGAVGDAAEPGLRVVRCHVNDEVDVLIRRDGLFAERIERDGGDLPGSHATYQLVANHQGVDDGIEPDDVGGCTQRPDELLVGCNDASARSLCEPQGQLSQELAILVIAKDERRRTVD